MPAEAPGAGGKARCPICGAPSRPETRPFCSKRCRDVDLHRWLAGTYAVPAREDDEDGSPPLSPDDEPTAR